MRKTFVAAAFVAIAAGLIVHAQDAKALMSAASMAMGSVNNVEIWGIGTQGTFGQGYAPGGPWATFKVTSYHTSFNYSDNTMHVELERTNPVAPVRGGGGLPLVGPANPQKQDQRLNQRVAWNVNLNPAPGADPNAPQQAALLQRRLDFWTSPHAVLLAADANNATADGRVLNFKMFTIPVKVTIGTDNLVSKVEYTQDMPVLGDTVTETDYTLYKTFGNAKFPTHITIKQGGFPILDLTVNKVEINGVTTILAVPATVQQAFNSNPPPAVNSPPPTPMVTTTKMADGVYFLTGGTHHSMAVEFADYSVLFEVPNNEQRAMAVIEATKKAIPNKPLRYVIVSHNHFDHLGGVRAAMAEGITLITQAANKPYLEQVAKMPHTTVPDALAKSPKTPTIEVVMEKRVLMDGTNTLELYHLVTDHSSTMLMGYLPKQRVLYEVDVFNAPAPNAPPPPPNAISPVTKAFYTQLQAMKLDVQQILPAHGPGATTMTALKSAAGVAN